MKRKQIVVLALMIICLALLAAGTLAFFAEEETAHNVITMGSLEMTLHDETLGGKPFPTEGIGGVLPNTEVAKVVYLENTGNVDFYARIALDRSITPAEGVTQELTFEHIALDLNTTDWTEQDGYFYYNRALTPGEETEPLFTTVTFAPEMGNEYMNAHVEIVVSAQAVQSRNNGGSPLEAVGWTTE